MGKRGKKERILILCKSINLSQYVWKFAGYSKSASWVWSGSSVE